MSVFSVQTRLIYLTDETFSAALPLLPAHSLVHFFSLGCLGSFIALILLLSYLPLSLTFTQIISLHGSLRGKYQRLWWSSINLNGFKTLKLTPTVKIHSWKTSGLTLPSAFISAFLNNWATVSFIYTESLIKKTYLRVVWAVSLHGVGLLLNNVLMHLH